MKYVSKIIITSAFFLVYSIVAKAQANNTVAIPVNPGTAGKATIMPEERPVVDPKAKVKVGEPDNDAATKNDKQPEPKKMEVKEIPGAGEGKKTAAVKPKKEGE